MKKCYYEVLGVERDAGDDDIKKAFRRLALQLHPDKNPDRVEDAKAEFQVIQQAYAVLSNPQERAWYDEHRQAVLREGLENDFDFNIDLMAYCTSTCYKGYGDDDEGFYTIYRKLFEQLTAEELEAGWEDEHDEDIPNFGDSLSSYEEVVGPFYAFWEAFCTVKSFAWNDEYDTRKAECRRVARLMDKENKKVRMEYKKAWNREVRALVDFIKRKDKRVQAWKVKQEAIMKERQEELARKAKEAKAKRAAERKKLLESAQKNKQNMGDHAPVLQEMEQWMSNEFGDQLSGSEDDEATCYHCAACNKSFRTEKAYLNHEKSKKHLQQLEKLRELMEEEDELFEGTDDDDEAEEDPNKTDENEEVNDVEEESESEIPDALDDPVDSVIKDLDSVKIRKASESSNSNPTPLEEGEEEEEEDDILLTASFGRKREKSSSGFKHEDVDTTTEVKFAVTSDDEDETLSKKSGKKQKKNKKKQQSKAQNSTKTNNATPQQLPSSNNPPSKKDTEPTPPPPPVDSSCLVCKEKFPSRSELFKHIKSSGHAAPLSTLQNVKEQPPAKQRGKGKQRKNIS